MSAPSAFLSREAVRHGAASVIAGVATAVVVILGLATESLDGGPSLTSLFVTLLFGLYGPVFLLLTWSTFRGLEGERLRTQLARTDERNRLIRWLFLSSPVSWAATVLIIGVVSVILLTTGEGESTAWIVPICLVGVAGSWVLMVAIMAVEYMRRWAAEDSLEFPGRQARSFIDFVYVSVQMSTTFSSADVQLTRRTVRGLASLHSVLAFAYSTAIIAVFASLLITLPA